MQKIMPCLWFQNNDGADAVAFYSAIFGNSRVVSEIYWGKQGGDKEGSLLAATFELDGMRFQILNGGPHDAFNDAISLSISCKDQAEVDYYWDRLLEGGGKEVACSWLKDKFGVSWQVAPEALLALLADPDRAKADRVMAAMMKMVKIDLAAIEEAARG
jgi:two-component system sensor histidine kinase QseC